MRSRERDCCNHPLAMTLTWLRWNHPCLLQRAKATFVDDMKTAADAVARGHIHLDQVRSPLRVCLNVALVHSMGLRAREKSLRRSMAEVVSLPLTTIASLLIVRANRSSSSKRRLRRCRRCCSCTSQRATAASTSRTRWPIVFRRRSAQRSRWGDDGLVSHELGARRMWDSKRSIDPTADEQVHRCYRWHRDGYHQAARVLVRSRRRPTSPRPDASDPG
jgi:hypothetical protein